MAACPSCGETDPALCCCSTTLAGLIERLAMIGVDVDPDTCDTEALRSAAADMLQLAGILDA